MGELYIDPRGNVVNQESLKHTGNEEVDNYINSLPVGERENALKEITAPITGEEVSKLMKENENYKPSYEEFKAFNEHQKTNETSLIEGLGMFADAASGIYDIAGNVISQMFSHPIDSAKKLAPSLIEGGRQNIRNWYGMIAQSQDPQSVLFKWKNALARDGSIDAYKQFLEARDFNKETVDIETGKKTLVFDKGLIDPSITQAATIIVDPMFYGGLLAGVVTGGASAEFSVSGKIAQILGMSEQLTKAASFASKTKSLIYGGALKYGVGVPLEFIGGITRGAIDKTLEVGGSAFEGLTGVTAKDFKTMARVGGFGSIAYGTPYLSTTSKTYLTAGFLRGAGESLQAIGDVVIKNQGKRGLLSFAEQAMLESDAILAKGGSGLSTQARKILNVIDKVDPMLSYANAGFKGGVHGAIIGGGLGALGGNSEGFYSGAGAGFGIGSIGGVVGRGMSNIGGGLEKARLATQMDMLMPMFKEFDPLTHSAYDLIRQANRLAGNPDHIVDRYIVAMDKIAPETALRANGAVVNEALIRSLGHDPATYDGFQTESGSKFEPKPASKVPHLNKIEQAAVLIGGIDGYIPESIHKQILNGDLSVFKAYVEAKGVKNFTDIEIKQLAEKIILDENKSRTDYNSKKTELNKSQLSEIKTLEEMMARGENNIHGEKITPDYIEIRKNKYLKINESYKNRHSSGNSEHQNASQLTKSVTGWLDFLLELEPSERAKALADLKLTTDDKIYNELVKRAKEKGLVNSKGVGESETTVRKYKLDKDGNKIRLRDSEGFTVPTMDEFKKASGWTIVDGKDGRIKIHINTDNFADTSKALPHEIFHAVFKELAMRPEFQQRLNEHILGVRDENGKVIKKPTISKSESRDFFRNYISREYANDDQAKQIKLKHLDTALNEFYDTGKMTTVDSNGELVLPKLVEEFGAYYFTHFTLDKPVDYMFRGGQFSGMRGVMYDIKNAWQDYMERKVGNANAGFDFKDSEGKINPRFYDEKGKRIRVSALDYMMQDLIRTQSSASRGRGFDFRELSPEGQKQYVESSGSPDLFQKNNDGTYTVRTPQQQIKHQIKKGIAMHIGLKAFAEKNPEALRIKDANGKDIGGLSADADGNFSGQIPVTILDYFVKSGHITQIEADRISLFQKSATGEIKGNIFILDGYTGETMNVGVGQDVRVSGDLVPTKNRTVLLLGIENTIKKDGNYSFATHTLDWKNIETRANTVWKDPSVQSLWGGDRDLFMGDFFAYLKNASQPDGVRKPSATLWSEKGEVKRNIMHQVAGISQNAEGTINKPISPISNDLFSSYRKFRTDRMTGVRLSGESVDIGSPSGSNDAVNWIRTNMMPSDFSEEKTPTGAIYSHSNGYKFIKTDNKVKVYKPDGSQVGVYDSMESAVRSANIVYLKDNPKGKPIVSGDNIRNEPNDVIETRYNFTKRKLDELRKLSKEEFDNFLADFLKEGEYDNIELEIVLDRIKQDYIDLSRPENNPNPNYTLQEHIINELENLVFEKNQTFEQNKSSLPQEPYSHSNRIQSGIDVEKFFNKKYSEEYLSPDDTFKSGLMSAVEKIFETNLDKNGEMSAARLISLLSKQTSGEFGRVQTEANLTIGLIDDLKKFGQNKIKGSNVIDYLNEHGMKVTVDTEFNQKADFGSADRYVAEGDTLDHYTFVARLNDNYAHQIEGHYGKDVVVHIRATGRIDANGKRVLFVEEIQLQNTRGKILEPEELKKAETRLSKLDSLLSYVRDFQDYIEGNTEKDLVLKSIDKFNDFERNNPKLMEELGYLPDSPILQFRHINAGKRNRVAQQVYDAGVQANLRRSETKRAIWSSKQSGKYFDRPLQDLSETTKIASRVIMRKAVELGYDRVAFVRSEDTHPKVDMRKERGQRLYDVSIPEMVNGELKKFGSKLELDKNPLNKPKTVTEQILAKSLGYEITPEMKKAVSKQQTFYMPSEEGGKKDRIIYIGGGTVMGSTRGAIWATTDFNRIEKNGGVKAYEISPNARILRLRKAIYDRDGNQVDFKEYEKGFKEIERIAKKNGILIDYSRFRRDGEETNIRGGTMQEFLPYDSEEVMNMNHLDWEKYLESEKSTAKELDKRALLQAIIDEGYDIIEGDTIEGQGTIVLNKDAIKELTVDNAPEIKVKKQRFDRPSFMPADESGKPIQFKDWASKTEQEVGSIWTTPFYKKLIGSIIDFNDIGKLRILSVAEDKKGKVKVKTISEEKYQSITKRYPEGKVRDDDIRKNALDWVTEDRFGKVTHPFYYQVSDIKTIQFDKSEYVGLKNISFSHSALKDNVESGINDLEGVNFDKGSSTILFGKKVRGEFTKGILGNIQDAVAELGNAKTPEDIEFANNKINQHLEELRNLKDELQDKHDNTPESFQENEAYTNREEALDTLDSVISDIENSVSDEQNGSNNKTSYMPSEEGENWSTQKAIQARENQPRTLWVYPNTDNFLRWSENLPKLKSLDSQIDTSVLEKGFVTTVFKGVSSRDFDTFKDRSLNDKGVPVDAYLKPIGDKADPNYFISDFNSAKGYGGGNNTWGFKLSKKTLDSMGRNDGTPDMYYIKSKKPAILFDVKKGSKIYDDIKTYWEKHIKGEFYEDYISGEYGKIPKQFDVDFDLFLKELNKGEFLNEKFWGEGREGQGDMWLAMSKYFLNEGYDSVVVRDNTTSKTAPTIVIDQASKNVKASSNYGDFSSTDNRYNFMPAEEGGNQLKGKYEIDKLLLDDFKSLTGLFSEPKAKFLLESIVRFNGQYSEIAKLMLESEDIKGLNTPVKNIKTRVRIGQSARYRTARSHYVPDRNEINLVFEKLSEQGKQEQKQSYEQVIIEEILHALTVKKIPKNLKSQISESSLGSGFSTLDSVNMFLDKLDTDWNPSDDTKNWGIISKAYLAVHNHYESNLKNLKNLDYRLNKNISLGRDNFDFQGWADKEIIRYRLTSMEEFIVGVVQDKAIQEILKNVKLEKNEPNLLNKLFNIIKKMWGFSDEAMGTLLELTSNSAEKIIKRTRTYDEHFSKYDNRKSNAPSISKDINFMPAEQESAWRNYTQEKTSAENSVYKNTIGYTIVYLNKKFKVYNPSNGLIGIYNDIEQAKRRVQRDEPKKK